MSPRPSPVVNHIYEMNCNYVFYRLVSQINIRWWDYVIIRLESLCVEGQEIDFVHVSMQNNERPLVGVLLRSGTLA
jgi:hypothetical protein